MSESLVSIRQTGECESSSHDLFKFPLKPIQRWRRFMSPPPTSTPPPHWRRWPWGEMMWVRLGKAKVAARHPPKQAWEHSHEKYAKKVFFGNQTFEKKEKHSTHTHTPMRYDHKALISISVRKESCISNRRETWWWRLSEQMLQHQELPVFCFFSSSVSQLSTDPWHMLDLHTHRHHRHPHPYLFWDLTPPPQDDNATQPSRAAQARERTGH